MDQPALLILVRSDMPLYEQMQACAEVCAGAAQAAPAAGPAAQTRILSCPSASILAAAKSAMEESGAALHGPEDSRAAAIGPLDGLAVHSAERSLFSLGCAPFSAEPASQGVRITPSSDPLSPAVELSPAKLSEAALLFSLSRLASAIQEAAFSLPLDHPDIDGPASRLLIRESERLDEINLPEDSVQYWRAHADMHQFPFWLASLSEPHAGDCCAIACSCTRCGMESYVGIDTRPSSKAEGHRLWAMRQRRKEAAAAASSLPTPPRM